MAFDLSKYETVSQKIQRWHEKYPNGRLITHVDYKDFDKGMILICAMAYRDSSDQEPAGVDWAYGNVAFYPAPMKRFFVEDTSTSALGRVVSLVLGLPDRSSREDMMRVEQSTPKPDPWDESIPATKHIDGFTSLGEATDIVKEKLGGEIQPEAPTCKHGHRLWRESKPEAPKEWAGYFCPDKVKANQCDPIWMIRSASTGEWRLP